MNTPLVSVIMPVYNSEKYLKNAVDSILNQTYTRFEFFIVDDGSTDASREIIARFAATDKRIIALYSEQNAGYVKHLNDGIQLARGEYIARMDSDDVSLPERLALQVAFLEAHPQVAVVGSSTIKIGEDGANFGQSPRNTSPASLFWQSFFTNPLAHPSVMFRKSVILGAGLYDAAKMPAEDFDLWTRVLRKNRLANIEAPLLKYRLHDASVSSTKRELQRRKSTESLRNHWLSFFGVRVEDEILYFFKNYHRGLELSPESARPAYYLILRLYLRAVLMFGFSEYVERDAFAKLYYLVSRSRGSNAKVIELSMTLGLLFPWRTLQKLATK